MAVPAEYRTQHEAFARGPGLLRAAIQDLTVSDLTARSGGAGWTTRDIMVHLADMELVRAVRIRMMLAEEEPVLAAVDEDAWQRRLQYLWRSPEAALTLFEMTRFGTAEILSHCGAEAWERAGIHAEDGRVSVLDLVERGVRHVDEHVAQIGANRGKAGS